MKLPADVRELFVMAGRKGRKARGKKLSLERKQEIGRAAARVRWDKKKKGVTVPARPNGAQLILFLDRR